MPHAVEPFDDEDRLENQLIARALDPNDQEVQDLLAEGLEGGDKADDAVDYGDLSDDDDDLPEEEEANQPNSVADIPSGTVAQGSIEDEAFGNDFDDIDDLFGEGPSSPVDAMAEGSSLGKKFNTASLNNQNVHDLSPLSLFGPQRSQEPENIRDPGPTRDGQKKLTLTKEEQEQRDLFAMSAMGSEMVPQPVQNAEELLATLWPKFERNTVPYFMDLVPGRRMHYQGKTPPKPPKALQINKLNLELAPDQEKSFKVLSGTNKRTREDLERSGVITIEADAASEKADEEVLDMSSDFEDDVVGGASWQELQIACQDWDIASLSNSSDGLDRSQDEEEQDTELEWPDAKRRKIHSRQGSILHNAPIQVPSLHDPEATTAKIARRIILDLNDSELLIDHLQPATSGRPGARPRDKKTLGREGLSQGLSQRYNISNDEAYDLLKENHQQKIRGVLGNGTIAHSLPALRLQWPFYKTKLEKQEARSFHRPSLNPSREQITFAKPRHVKRKALRGKPAQDVYVASEDLSLADNSTVLLLEYSEEHPAMISNMGMGNRIINFYRRKTVDDNTRPKLDIGDLTVLMPQDKSPFSLFGHIDPGEITPAITNGMYKAPIFPQEAKNTDFLVVRSTTGIGGSKWFMRSIENLRIVGQEFPSVDIPGPHSRKVTTASKNRLKMISYRLIRRNKTHRVSVPDVTEHFIESTDMQNRQKMKEFLQFDKDSKEWRIRSGDIVPTEDVVRTMVKPEDVCLLESMQVGQQHLQDSGFSKEDGNSEDDEAKEGQNIEQLLAPWSTSKNFLHATQGKAMLQLHGEGDPSGRGEAFSFIKTSMKGGFRAMGESVEEKLQGKRLKENNGHGYNVQRQQQQYEESIRRIWEKQKFSLSSKVETNEKEADDDDEVLDDVDANADIKMPSRMGTPGTLRRQDDETASQSTRFSTRSQAGKILEIIRQVEDKYGNVENVTEIVRNPRVIRMYLKKRHEMEAAATKLDDLVGPTGEADLDKRHQKFLQKELARLERNKERRQAREKQKGILPIDGADDAGEAGSPGTPASAVPKSTGTSRKCANCGQAGHIKTNKKLCPMLNGTMKPEEGFSDNAFTASAPAL